MLWHGSPMGSQVLPSNLSSMSSSPWFYSSCQEPASMWTLHGLCLPSGHIHLWRGVLRGLRCGYTLHCGPLWAAGGQPASPWSSSQAVGQSLLQHGKLLLVYFFTDLAVFVDTLLTFSHLTLSAAVLQRFSPFLCYHGSATMLLIGSAWARRGSILEPAGTSSV